jgi:hypothetical protein
MNAFKACFDGSLRYKNKPDKYSVALISDRLPLCVRAVTQDKIESFVSLISQEGVPFCPATFTDGLRNAEHFEQLQLLALDFDGNSPETSVTFEDIKQRADKLSLPILFAYDTHSSINHNKFRVVFLNDVPVPKKNIAGVMINALHTIFPESDPSCKDVSRMFYGGKYELYFDESIPTVNILSIITGMTKHLEDQHGKTNYKKKILEFNRINHVSSNKKGMPDVLILDEPLLAEETGALSNNKISPNPSDTIEGFGDNLLNRYYQITFTNGNTNTSAKEKENSNHAEFRAPVFNEIRSNCQLFGEFETGCRRLHHMELFGLATNMTKVETGTRLFIEIFKKNSYQDNRVGDIDYWVHQLKNYIKDYRPQSCEKFCPYINRCLHGTNILSAVKVKHRQMEKIYNSDELLVTAEEAAADFRQKLSAAVEACDNKWHIIKAQTAIGKTEAYLHFIKNLSQKTLIVVPTNNLKHEVCERAKAMGTILTQSPSLHEFKESIPEHIWSHIEKLYESGMSAIPYLKKIIKEDDPECSKLFRQYLKKLDTFSNCEENAITTHRRFLTMDISKYELIIIDEDILFYTIIPNKTDLSATDLKRVYKGLPPEDPVARKIRNALKLAKENEFFTLPKIHFERADDDKPMGVDISSFSSATHFCVHKVSDQLTGFQEDYISFLNPVEFNANVKHIMVSATVDKAICEYFFGERNIKFYDCKKAKYTGDLRQYYERSMSRADIKKSSGIISRIKRWSRFQHTITFMSHSLGGMYFGNCAGRDYLKGENIDVIGTPHQPEWIYKLFAYTHVSDFINVDAKIRPGATVTHNGYKFLFTTYDDAVLKAIQFYMIESELEQAVGRARLLRKNCTVNLFSNFPLSQAVMLESEYDKNETAD